MKNLVNIVAELIIDRLEVFSAASSERVIQDILFDALKEAGFDVEKRISLTSERYPSMEVDILIKNFKACIEVKLKSKFYDGIGQVVALKTLYGLSPILIHFAEGLDEKVFNAFRDLSHEYGLSVIIVDVRSGSVKVV